MKFNILWNGKIILIIWMQIIDQIFFKYHLNKNNTFIFLLYRIDISKAKGFRIVKFLVS